jgi:hypothetical protein
MNRKYKLSILAAVALTSAALISALAGTPFTETVTLGTTTGTGAYTNTRDYVAVKLVSIEFFNSSDLVSTCAVTRVRSARTNSVASVALSAGAGIHRETNTIYLFKNDVLKFANSTATGAVAEITGILEP